jgi:hypothetical protein
MSLLRTTLTARLTRLPGLTFASSSPLRTRPISTTRPLLKAQGYGDGEGDPRGNNPQAQGSSNSTKQHAEHPGPAPPSAGQSMGAGPTKGSSSSSGSESQGKSPEDASAQSGGSRSKEATETGESPTGGEVGGKSGPGPRIHSKGEPEATSGKESEDVKQHNREFEKRHDRAPPAEDDKVDEKFWEGECGSVLGMGTVANVVCVGQGGTDKES